MISKKFDVCLSTHYIHNPILLFLSFLPPSLLDQWSDEYVRFLLETVEDPPMEDEEEQIPDAFLNMILSFNQHFPGMLTAASIDCGYLINAHCSLNRLYVSN